MEGAVRVESVVASASVAADSGAGVQADSSAGVQAEAMREGMVRASTPVAANSGVGAIFSLYSQAQTQSPSQRHGGSGFTHSVSSVLQQQLRSFSSPSSGFHTAALNSPSTFLGTEDVMTTLVQPHRRPPQD
jgi:hypothetical protein